MPSRPVPLDFDTGTTCVLAWGAGEDGQLGLRDLKDKHVVTVVDALSAVTIEGVVAGSRNSMAFSDEGQLYTWGWNQRGTLGHPPDKKTESCPSQVKALNGVRIVQAATGGWHCLAVDEEGRAYAWGGNEYGQCAEEADGKTMKRDITIPQRCAPHLRVRQVAAGGTHSVVLTQDGHVWSWGQPWPPGDIKQIATPVRVQGLEKVKVIAVGAFHNLALLESGELWAWGNNEYGQLGTGDTQPRAQPVQVKGLDGLELVDIAAGGWHSMALTAKGEVYGWGRGEHGRLGFGDDKSSKMVPAQVNLLEDEFIIQISCGGTHSVALTKDGRMFSFGRGDHGRLGDGRQVTTGHPLEVPIDISRSGKPIRRSRDDSDDDDDDEEEEEEEESGTSSESADGCWRIKAVACGGQHTMAIAVWDGTPEEE
ncbi:hypothetical protein MPTK1_8g17940 [Marchantia polymorpha subsp. ruderalis]|uniref:RCC1-like domain-containing protein n=1 Tax=Marchantia polymorpha TaxID=3197 RepID=A0A2R6X8H7_MARPO|nr:hypothetical protein MARPO_0030s0128 [Marchantia polymorpha]BBN20285.1 hypothetical protein Mp_8g17940 [Marchantia polymorpha subsp. ruderalis]|eukprot:PTQ42405.1 hypothetical protein MARPO_0030s0128 [Marchantia polymorpha]